MSYVIKLKAGILKKYPPHLTKRLNKCVNENPATAGVTEFFGNNGSIDPLTF
jgi:hypothetical protein